MVALRHERLLGMSRRVKDPSGFKQRSNDMLQVEESSLYPALKGLEGIQMVLGPASKA
jgi:hypothetical protein